MTVCEIGLDFAFDGGFTIDDLQIFEVCFFMIFIEEHGLGLGYLLLLLVEGDIVMVYSFGEEVIVFIEVDFE